jgi:plastocyanin
MNKFILIGGVIILGVGVLFFFQSSQVEVPSGQPEMMGEGMIEEMEEVMDESGNEMMTGDEMGMMAEHTVVYSNEGYTPKELTIKKGDRVTFRNESVRETWPASAMHPSHNVYPGSSIQKCESEEMT